MSEFAYTPQGAVTAANPSSSLSRDVLVAANVPIYPESISPIAAFVNPNTANPNTTNQFIEALAVTADLNTKSPVLAHLTRSAGNQGELTWVSNSLGVAALEVAAGTALIPLGAAQPYGFFHDGINLYWVQLNGTAWSAPTQFTPGEPIKGLKVAYSSASGSLILYGQAASGNLALCWQDGNAQYNYMETNVAVSSDVQVTVQDGDSGQTWYAASISGGTLTIAQGTFASSEAQSVSTSPAGGGQVVLGYWNWQAVAPAFMYLDGSGGLNSYCGSSAPIPQAQSVSATSATGFLQNGNSSSVNGNHTYAKSLYATQSIHMYSLDGNGVLWVLHQDPDQPWNADNTPNLMGGQIPLTSGITHVIADMNPADVPTLFAVDSGQYIPGVNSVRMHFQDPMTNYWQTDYLRVPPAKQQTLEVPRYRNEIAISDSNGIPVPNCPLTLSIVTDSSDPTDTASTIDIAVNGQTYLLAPGAPVQNLATDARGKLTFSIVASGSLAVPQITVTDNAGYGINTTVTPSAPLHSYFAGTGTLNNNLQPFGSDGTLSGATVTTTINNTPVTRSIIPSQNQGSCGAAAQAVSDIGTNAPNILSGSSSNTADFRAIHFDLSDRANARVHTFTDRASLEAHLKSIPMASFSFASWIDGIGDDIAKVGTDIVHGIEQGVAIVEHATLTFAEGVYNFAVTVGDQLVSFVVKTAEDIGHALSTAFMWVVDTIEDVIEWLKAIFNLGAIMRTQAAFVSAVKQLIGDPTANPPTQGYIVTSLASQASAANGWFTNQFDQINAMFASLNPGTIGGQQGYAPPGAPSSTNVPNTQFSPNDCTNNVHHNFIQEKVSSGGPAASPASGDSSLATTWGTFETNLGDALSDFECAMTQLLDGLQTIITNPSSFGSGGVSDFLSAAQSILDALLALADAGVQGLCAMAEEVMTSLATMLTAPIGDGFLNTIWSWVGGTGELTLLDLFALILAFPATIIYAISNDGNEPYPSTSSFAAMDSFAAVSPILMFLAGELQMFYFVPAAASLGLGSASPWQLTLVMVVMSALIFVLSGGIQDLTAVQWSELGSAAAPIVFLCFIAAIIVQSLAAAQKQMTVTTLGNTAKIFATGIGILQLVFTCIAAESSSPPPPALTAAHVLLSLPTIFSVLQTSYATKPPFAPYTSVISGIAITVGYIGGGCADLASTAS